MADIVQLRKKAQVTLPLAVRRKLGLEEGDYMDVQVRENEIVLRPKKLVDKEQAYFWTKRWQEGEQKAEADIAAGRVSRFDGAEQAIASLHEEAEKYRGKKR